jgi:hypothetical protein
VECGALDSELAPRFLVSEHMGCPILHHRVRWRRLVLGSAILCLLSGPSTAGIPVVDALAASAGTLAACEHSPGGDHTSHPAQVGGQGVGSGLPLDSDDACCCSSNAGPAEDGGFSPDPESPTMALGSWAAHLVTAAWFRAPLLRVQPISLRSTPIYLATRRLRN